MIGNISLARKVEDKKLFFTTRLGTLHRSAVLLDIKRHRDEMLSANFVLTQRVLKRMQDGDWGRTQERLLSDYPDHPKSRMVEHLSIIILYLEEMFKAMGSEKQAWELVRKWMDSQKDTAVTEIIESDPIIQALDIIRDSAWKQWAYDDSHFGDEEKRERTQVIKLDVRTLLSTVAFTKGTSLSAEKPESSFQLSPRPMTGILERRFPLISQSFWPRGFPTLKLSLRPTAILSR